MESKKQNPNPEESVVAIVTMSELAKIENPIVNEKQLAFILKKTPANHIYERPAKGGGKWKYVTGVYVKKVLNMVFGWDWSFEIKDYKFDVNIGQAFVHGRLTCNSGGKSIVKEQFGRVDIKFKKETDANGNRVPLDIGNDLKAAATDALKKCAAELGIASDVYNPTEFKEIRVVADMTSDEMREEIEELFWMEGLTITEEERNCIQDILDKKEVSSYKKALKLLRTKIPVQNEE